MNAWRTLVFVAAAAAVVCSCGSGYPLFVNTTLAEAENLRQFCDQQKIRIIEVQKADSLAVAARNKAREGNENEAYWMADAAASYYRLALAKFELANVKTEMAELKKELAATREQLSTYKEVLNELESMKGQ